MRSYLLDVPPPPRPPFKPAPRYWKGNMCGVRVPGLPPVPGGAADPALVLSWFYDRYSLEDRARIRAAWKARDYTHVVLSWPDSRGFAAQQHELRTAVAAARFAYFCDELIADGFYPCPFLCSKDFDPPDVLNILEAVQPLIPWITQQVRVPLVCIGWELSLWLTPDQVQQLNDALAPPFVAAEARVYNHFQQRYMSFPREGETNGDFWKRQVGKLTGVLAQKRLTDNDHEFLDWINDCLERCAGNDGMPATVIDGHGVDFVALEIDAANQFNGAPEAEGDRLGRLAISATPRTGPAGTAIVQGSGNGF